MMNPEVKTKWVTALRSGKYMQTRRKLKDATGYCCLGVLCVISNKETGFGLRENQLQIGTENIGNTIRMWADLPLNQGAYVTIDAETDTLSAHNDQGRTFLQIADAIEAQL